MIKIFNVGGEPTQIAFLAEKLEKMVDNLQSSGWIIKDINHFKDAMEILEAKTDDDPFLEKYLDIIENSINKELEKTYE